MANYSGIAQYITDVKPLEDAGLDDAQIAFALSVKTAIPIPCEAAKVALEGSGAIVEDPVTQTRSGPLIDHYSTLTGTDAVLLSWFISHVMTRGVEITSDSYPRCVEMASVIGGLPAELTSVAEEIIALGGGYPNSGLTEAGVVQCRNDYNAIQAMLVRRQEANAKYNEFLAPVLSDVNSTDADIVAALQLWSASYTE